MNSKHSLTVGLHAGCGDGCSDDLAAADLFGAELAAGAHHLATFGATAFDEDAFFDEPRDELIDLIFCWGWPGAIAAGVVGDEVEDSAEARRAGGMRHFGVVGGFRDSLVFVSAGDRRGTQD